MMATIMLMLYPSKTVQSSRHNKDVYKTEMINRIYHKKPQRIENNNVIPR